MSSELLQQFLDRWNSSDAAPDVFSFLREHDVSTAADQLAILLADQRHRWHTESPLSVEDYLTRLPEISSEPNLVLQLAVGEFHARQNDDTSPDIDEFTGRFPDISDTLRSKLTEVASGDKADSVAFKTTQTFINTSTIGEQRIGRYRLERILGEGAYGRVYLGFDEELQRQVAIKVPTPERFQKPEDAEAYLAEARTVGSLDHPNIVPVYDVGRTEDGSIYVVSKFIEGCTLADLIKNDRPGYPESATLLATVATAVHHAHEKRLVHRDVKPANILIEDSTGTPYVADFGLAIREEDYLKGGKIAGTPAYMSPEQARGEGHRLDGRSDIFSLGVVLYELLTGKRPFRGSTPNELLHQVVSVYPPHPRELNDSIPVELERICLKSLSKRASDRYSTAAELAHDYAHFDQTPEQPQREVQVVPKGLRSFDAEDADFFLDLLPGPRNRDGLPESIQFWKTRIEETDPDKTFAVGLIYGPSGCGKSSLVKAGLLPRLPSDVAVVYVEATPDETEIRILRGLRKRLPDMPGDLGLVETFAFLRRGEGCKVLIVVDQFEQWLHAHRAEPGSELVDALRQCDGGTLQAVVMVRDDFWMAASQFAQDLEVRFHEGSNASAVNLFGEQHAIGVLSSFGQAYGCVEFPPTDAQRDFIQQAVKGLAEDGKVVSVQIALLADMVKEKEWSLETLEGMGGTEGVGVTFLEETFSARTAPPEHRFHQQTTREVLKALLPEVGTDIKGHMRSHGELLDASGYANRPGDFNDLLRILDGELRLITPTDPDGFRTESDSDPGSRHYQLTHDYLVPSLREWLTRKQKETRRGRAELRLADRSALWNAKPENRHLPAWWEYLNITLLVSAKNWTDTQRRMMTVATRHYGLLAACGLVLLLVMAFALQQFLTTQQRKVVRGAVDAQQSTIGAGVPFAIRDLERMPKSMVLNELQSRFDDEKDERKLPLAYALARFGQGDRNYLINAIPDARAEECDNLADAFRYAREEALQDLKNAAASATAQEDWPLKARFAAIALHLEDTSIAAQMLQAEPPKQTSADEPEPDWQDAPLNPAWKAVDADTKATIEAAHGMMAERFALCQDMPWNAFLTTVETLRPCGYRPTRVRPFIRDSQRLATAVWTRDARHWHLDIDQTADQLPPPDAAAARDGLVPADVAGYAAPTDTLLYALLWCECDSEDEQRRLAVGMADEELARIAATMKNAGFAAQLTLQVVTPDDGARRYAGIWSNEGPTTSTIPRYAISDVPDQPLADVSLAPIGRLLDPLDSYRQQLDAMTAWPPERQNDADGRRYRAKARYFLGQPEESLAELDSLATEEAATRQDLQCRALSLAKLGKAEEAKQVYEDYVEACSATAIEMGIDRYVGIIVSAWLGDFDEASRQLDALEESDQTDANVPNSRPSYNYVPYNAACAAAQMSLALAERNPAEAARLKERSLELLRSAVAHGYRNVSHLLSDADLAPLHGEAGFTALVAELAPAGLYAGLRYGRTQFASRLLADLSPDEQLEHAQELAVQGFRPVAVAANVVPGGSELRSAVVWNRAPIPEFEWDPIQRTMFIEHLPKWSGDLKKVADLLRDTSDTSFRSGMSLAVGSVEQPGRDLKGAWQGVLADWFLSQPDSGSHSAAAWALRNWDILLPEIPEAERRREGSDWELTPSGLTMIRIRPGEFRSESQQASVMQKQRVKITREFWLSDCEITVDLFRQFLNDGEHAGEKPNDLRVAEEDPQKPIAGVSWYDAVIFCNWLSTQDGFSSCYEKRGKEKFEDNNEVKEYDAWHQREEANGYRLPTEAEWEYACRAGTTTAFSFGDDENLLDRYGVFAANSRGSASPVGSKRCNGRGLFDMHGNAYEWCQDWYIDGSARGYRGGCWNFPAARCRMAYRRGFRPTARSSLLGFRVARVPSASSSKVVSGVESGG